MPPPQLLRQRQTTLPCASGEAHQQHTLQMLRAKAANTANLLDLMKGGGGSQVRHGKPKPHLWGPGTPSSLPICEPWPFAYMKLSK
jgi:hypothetical protein